MKLLLTSAGITNKSIARALVEMVGKPAGEMKVFVVSTAANVEEGNKDWFINQFNNLWRFGFEWVDMVDPTAAEVEWQGRLDEADVVFISGGNTFYLLDQARKTGFGDWLKQNIESKVYVGVSAGSIFMGKTIEVGNIEPADRNVPGIADLSGLGFVDFDLEPHCDRPRFEVIRDFAKGRSASMYALDDQSAIRVTDDKIDVVSEGAWKLYNERSQA